MDEVTVGARLRTLRRWRGLTQVELAGLAGVSPSFLSMVEHGTRMLDRRSHIAAVASALRVSETDIAGGPHLSGDRVQSDPHMGIPSLRVCLKTNTLTSAAVDRGRPVSELHQVVFGQVEPLRRVCGYVRLGGLLPEVLDELHWHVAQPADEAGLRLALESLVEACVVAAAVAKELGYLDLAHLAAVRGREAAGLLDDPVQVGKGNSPPPKARTWGRRGHTPVVRASGRGSGRMSVAGLACLKAGEPGRFSCRMRGHRLRPGTRRAMSEADDGALNCAAHRYLNAPVIVIRATSATASATK